MDVLNVHAPERFLADQAALISNQARNPVPVDFIQHWRPPAVVAIEDPAYGNEKVRVLAIR